MVSDLPSSKDVLFVIVIGVYKFYQYVPHKAVAEVSKIVNYRRGSLL